MYVYTMDNEKEVLKENLHTPTYKFTVRAGSNWTVVQYSFFFCSPEVRIYKRTQERKKKRKKTRCRPRTD